MSSVVFASAVNRTTSRSPPSSSRPFGWRTGRRCFVAELAIVTTKSARISGVDRSNGPATMGGTSADRFRETLDAISLAAGWEQVLSRTLILEGRIRLYIPVGFPRQSVSLGVGRTTPGRAPRPTLPPFVDVATRLVHSEIAHLATGSVSILCRQLEAQRSQPGVPHLPRDVSILSNSFAVTATTRKHRRSSTRATPTITPSTIQYVTADPKLSAFHVNELGIQFLVLGAFLEGKAHRSIAGAQFDISFNYRWNTNAYRKPGRRTDRPTHSVLGDTLHHPNPAKPQRSSGKDRSDWFRILPLRRCDLWRRTRVIPRGCDGGECPYPDGQRVE